MLLFVLQMHGQRGASIDDIECLFDSSFQIRTATILSENEAKKKGVPLCLVRTDNSKLAIMAKGKAGNLDPYYMKGIETGFWDSTRNKTTTDYDIVFKNYRKLEANAVMFMIHWSDIEPEDGKFNFSYTDRILEKAEKYGLKVVWVLFMHQQNVMGCLPPAEDMWMYNLDTRNGDNYAIQWVKDKDGNIIKDLGTLKQHFDEIMPCYGNPKVYKRIIRMLGKLAAHYKNSESVIGVQIGNEEGITYEGSDADFNPYTLDLFERWKKMTGNTSWNKFKLEIVKLWWSRFTTAYHLQDPYKLTMFNAIGGAPEKGDVRMISRSGTDVTTYRDSKIDVIASMFYSPPAKNIWHNLDRIFKSGDTYSYPTQLPILMSTEIGLGFQNTLPHSQEYMINFLERGSQGFAVYAYGHLLNEDGTFNMYGDLYRKFMSMVKANEDIIWPGLPGAGNNISISTKIGGAEIGCLHKDDNATLGILHFPDALDDNTLESQVDVPIDITVKKAGKYAIEVYKDGLLTASQKEDLTAAKNRSFNMRITLSNKAASFVKVTKLN